MAEPKGPETGANEAQLGSVVNPEPPRAYQVVLELDEQGTLAIRHNNLPDAIWWGMVMKAAATVRQLT